MPDRLSFTTHIFLSPIIKLIMLSNSSVDHIELRNKIRLNTLYIAPIEDILISVLRIYIPLYLFEKR